MSLRAWAVIKEGHRHVMGHWRTFALLALPVGIVNIVATLAGVVDDGPMILVALPVLLLCLLLITWFGLALVGTIFRTFPHAPGPVRPRLLFRLGRGELRLLLYYLMTGAPVLLAAVVMVLGGIVSGHGGDEGVFLAMAFAFMVVAMATSFFLMIRLLPGSVAAVLGEQKPWSLGWRLTKGRFWKSALCILIPGGIFGLLNIGSAILFGGVILVAGIFELPVATMIIGTLAHSVIAGALSTATIVWYAAIMAALYHRLRGMDMPVEEPVPSPLDMPPSEAVGTVS